MHKDWFYSAPSNTCKCPTSSLILTSSEYVARENALLCAKCSLVCLVLKLSLVLRPGTKVSLVLHIILDRHENKLQLQLVHRGMKLWGGYSSLLFSYHSSRQFTVVQPGLNTEQQPWSWQSFNLSLRGQSSLLIFAVVWSIISLANNYKTKLSTVLGGSKSRCQMWYDAKQPEIDLLHPTNHAMKRCVVLQCGECL